MFEMSVTWSRPYLKPGALWKWRNGARIVRITKIEGLLVTTKEVTPNAHPKPHTRKENTMYLDVFTQSYKPVKK